MLYVIKIFDVENSGPLRDIHRDAHLSYVKGFDDQTMFSGPFLTLDLQNELGSARLIEFADRAALQVHIDDEPYILGGVQDGCEVYGWSPDTPATWRDCPRTEGNIQFMIEGHFAPGLQTVPEGMGLGRDHYLLRHHDNIITSGWLLDDDQAPAGTLMIVDAPDLTAAEQIWEAEPLRTAGLYPRTNFYGWRFGRVADRFKV